MTAALLPPNATPFEAALAECLGGRFDRLAPPTRDAASVVRDPRFATFPGNYLRGWTRTGIPGGDAVVAQPGGKIVRQTVDAVTSTWLAIHSRSSAWSVVRLDQPGWVCEVEAAVIGGSLSGAGVQLTFYRDGGLQQITVSMPLDRMERSGTGLRTFSGLLRRPNHPEGYGGWDALLALGTNIAVFSGPGGATLSPMAAKTLEWHGVWLRPATPAEMAAGRPLPAPDLSLDPARIRGLWSAERCPAPLLPWLAWALSVDTWSEGWTEETKRRVVAGSIALHRAKGSRASVERAIAAIGLGDVTVAEGVGSLFYGATSTHDGSEHYGETSHWAEYRVIAQRPISNAQADEVRAALRAVAPVRCHLAELRFTEALLYDDTARYDGGYNHGVA